MRPFRQDTALFRRRYRADGLAAMFYYPSYRTTLLIRASQWCFRNGARPVAYFLVLFNDLTAGVWVGPQVNIGPGLLLAHPRGLVVNPEVTIGECCTLGQQVTLGGPRTSLDRFVEVNAGAIVISTAKRPVHLGEFSVIGAGAVVTRDVEPLTVVAGVPATTIRKLTLEEWLFDRPWYAAFLDTEIRG